MEQSNYRQHGEILTKKHKLASVVGPTYLALLDFVLQQQFRGACHATTGILHVLLRSQGVNGRLVTGESQHDRRVFNHSWLEIDGLVYDVAIALPLDPQLDGHPVFASNDLVTLDKPFWNYGFSSGLADDDGVAVVKQQSFVDFMNNAPYHRHGLWHFVQKIGGKLHLKLSLNKLRAANVDEKWEIRSSE